MQWFFNINNRNDYRSKVKMCMQKGRNLWVIKRTMIQSLQTTGACWTGGGTHRRDLFSAVAR